MPLDPDLASRTRHAESYPFARPGSSYLFAEGGMQPLLPQVSLEGRMPILAVGANASPARLAAKFGNGDVIPVMRALLDDFVIVFAGHFCSYGAIPATLYPCPGARTRIWITWLTPAQQVIMHRSEGVIECAEAEQRYDHVELDGLSLRPDGMPPIARAGAYLSRRMLAPDGEPLRFAEIFSGGSGFQANSQPSILRWVHRRLDPTVGFTDFMAGVLSGIDRRQALFQALHPYTIDRET
ncbi:MAG: hypothetical protein OEU92_13235 [Alphaproteobacteria bacterium]|nr:hypothetical protein [Alphaproteobacteria bacterium]